MFKFTVLLLLISFVAISVQKGDPYDVLVDLLGFPICAGALVSLRAFISPASCVIGLPAILLRARIGSNPGISGGAVIKSIKIHPDFNVLTMANNMGMLILERNVYVTMDLTPILVGQQFPTDGSICRESGWGVPDPNFKVQIYERCSFWNNGQTMPESTFCGRIVNINSNNCNPGPGGSLVRNGKLFGLGLWGPECPELGLPQQYRLYTNAVRLRNWIQNNF